MPAPAAPPISRGTGFLRLLVGAMSPTTGSRRNASEALRPHDRRLRGPSCGRGLAGSRREVRRLDSAGTAERQRADLGEPARAAAGRRRPGRPRAARTGYASRAWSRPRCLTWDPYGGRAGRPPTHSPPLGTGGQTMSSHAALLGGAPLAERAPAFKALARLGVSAVPSRDVLVAARRRGAHLWSRPAHPSAVTATRDSTRPGENRRGTYFCAPRSTTRCPRA